MRKVKYLIAGIISLCFLIAGIVAVQLNSVRAEENTSTTFPIDEAGITAYVKLDSIDNIDTTALAEAFETIEKQGESYVVGKVPTTNNPHLYIGLDGWMVAYFLNTEEASRIAGSPTATTTLEEAIDYMGGKIGVTYSADSVKYYNFEFPEANKLTLITDSNDFYVTVPGILYEASYQISGKGGCGPCCWGCTCDKTCRVDLMVDGTYVFQSKCADVVRCESQTPFFGYYDTNTYFNADTTHRVNLIDVGYRNACCSKKNTTVLIYQN